MKPTAHRRWKRPCRWIVALLAVLGPRLTSAQPAPAEANADRAALIEKAQGFVNEASRAFIKKDFEAALVALKKAEALATAAADPALASIKFNIARCLEELGQAKDALTAYEAYNALPDDPRRKQRAFEAMKRLRGEVYATLTVACAPLGSLVEIAGLTNGTVSCPWRSETVPPGAYAVRVSHPGFESKIETVEVFAGRAFTVQAELKSLVPVDSVVVGAEPTNYWPMVTIGVGLAVAASGGFFTTSAIDDRESAQDLPPGGERDDLVDAFEFNRNVSYAMYSIGGAAVVGGIVWLILDGLDLGSDDPTALRVEPGPHGFRVTF